MDRPQQGAGQRISPDSPGDRATAPVPPAQASGTGLRPAEWLALAAAVVIAHLFYWRLVRYPSTYDAQGYLDIAEEIRTKGLFTKYVWSEIRTYAYPLFLSVLGRAASALSLPLGLVILETQLALYLLAAAFFRRRLAESWPSVAPWAFVAIVANPFALVYVPESLTESVSLTLLLCAAACWFPLAARGLTWRPVLAGSLALGTAVMVRPANVFALAAWVAALGAVCLARRPTARAWPSIALALLLGSALPMVPQYANNVRNYGQHTPLVVASLGRDQQYWGIENLKYATALFPEQSRALTKRPRVFYENPFAAGTAVDQEHPLAWYAANPGAGVLTLALHVFCMLDQDLLFTYSRDLDPWYRIPVGVLNHALIGLALIGGAMLAARARREPGLVPAALAVAAYALAHVGLHATTLVEMRFGLPLLLLAGPLALAAARGLAGLPSWSARATGAFVALWIAGSLALSQWVRQQAPLIREWEMGADPSAEKKRASGVPPLVAPQRAGADPGRVRTPQKPPKKKAKTER